MEFTRRRFLASSAGASLLSFFNPTRLLADALKAKPFAKVDGRQNLFMAFNNIHNPESGESDEFTTMHNLERVLGEMDVPRGRTVIGIGARTGFANSPYSAPGEMGYRWEYGTPFEGVVTHIKDASATPLGKDDPIMVTQVAVLDESTAHHFEYNDPAQAGKALWTFYNDNTGELGKGMHNLFSDMDGGMLETVYNKSQAALRDPNGWGTSSARNALQKFMPRLGEDKVWNNLSKTLGNTLIHSEWLPYIRKQGWPGAAIVLRGSMMNVAQFHIQEWNFRAANDGHRIQIGKGKHGPFHIQFGQEVRPFITPAAGTWTMVGFLWDLQSGSSTPSMKDYSVFSDLFGQDYHIHGFQDNGSVGGHTHFSMLSEKKLTVSLYPLSFQGGQTGFLFNNDLRFDKSKALQSSSSFSINVVNDGQNFLRNVNVQIATVGLFEALGNIERIVIPKMAPGESVRVTFKGAAATSTTEQRDLWIDRNGAFIEGGAGTGNNRVRFSPARG